MPDSSHNFKQKQHTLFTIKKRKISKAEQGMIAQTPKKKKNPEPIYAMNYKLPSKQRDYLLTSLNWASIRRNSVRSWVLKRSKERRVFK
jgi:hypothetical protein